MAGTGGVFNNKTKQMQTREMMSFTNISQSTGLSLTSSSRPVLSRPPQSSWFSYDEIHDIERRTLPEFFDGKSPSKTPEMFYFIFYLLYFYCLFLFYFHFYLF